jgi:transglutaminase-like putative cysteine protease
MHYANLEQEWQVNHVDYSAEIRFDLILYAGGVAALLLALAFLLPAFSITKLSQALLRQPSVNQAEETLGRVFAGVQQPRRGVDTGTDEPGLPGSPGGRGIMPRSFLLGNAPQLQETVVMRVAVRPLAIDGREITTTTAIPLPPHWRGLAYDVYTGRGWALSEERQEVIAADELIPLSPAVGQTTFSQSIQWVYDQRVIRYTVGLPLRFDHETTIFWRGLEDFSRAQGLESMYQATTRFTTASAADLRQTAAADIPPAILARYTALPDTLPARIIDLAQEVAGGLPTAYDQARALERFLRQYPYSLAVSLPARNVDPVDYFLFELQEGFCDYYASAMAVMARSLGLPARLVVGFLAQAPDESGIQTIYQINAHSWVEIYFAGYGWVEFEPTAAFPTRHDEAFVPFNATEPRVTFEPGFPPTPPIPEQQRHIWRRLWPVGLIGLLLLGWWWQQRQRVPPTEQDAVLWAYGRLQQSAQMLGQSIAPGYTPSEFASGFLAQLNTFAVQPSLIQPRLARLVNHVRPHIEHLISLFIKRQYGQRLSNGEEARIEETARQSWRNLRRPLWLLRLIHWLMSFRQR